MQPIPEFSKERSLRPLIYNLGLEPTSGGGMYITEIIAEMFWKDYQATWEGEAENWSAITILSDFLVWLDRRKTSGQLIDLRLIKNQTAKTVVDQLMESKKFS